MLRFTVRFDRYTANNNDLEIARENFPNLSDEKRLLEEQLRAELQANKTLLGLWDIYHSRIVNENLFCVWVGFDWPGTGPEFCEALQRTYDDEGMASFYVVLDFINFNAEVDRQPYQKEVNDTLEKWVKEANDRIDAEHRALLKKG